MKHKKVAGFLAILCILSSFFSWQAQAAQDISGNVSGDIRSEEEQEDISLWMQKMEMQEEATQAYSELRSLFGVSESGMDIFPDDYAGAWIENNDLIVGLTTLDSVEKYDLVWNQTQSTAACTSWDSQRSIRVSKSSTSPAISTAPTAYST